MQKKTEGDPAERQQEPDVIPENIIMIMNESLADFESIGSVRSDVEILPYIHSIDKNVTHGSLHMPTYGGEQQDLSMRYLPETVLRFFLLAVFLMNCMSGLRSMEWQIF
ncbi:MAG: hypothetical protein ACLRZ5_05210 [Ruminococcus sp.]